MSTTVEMEDLIQAGHMGVLKALSKFDPERGNTFATYATPWIRHYIRRTWQRTRLVRVPAPVASAAHYAGEPIPMTCTPLKGKRKQEGYETNPEEIIDSKRLSVSLNAALSELSPRSREIVVAHNYRETTFTSLATQFGISVERVKQLYKIAMEQLKESLSDVHGK